MLTYLLALTLSAAEPVVVVRHGQAKLTTWQSVEEREDGSPLNDTLTYKVWVIDAQGERHFLGSHFEQLHDQTPVPEFVAPGTVQYLVTATDSGGRQSGDSESVPVVVLTTCDGDFNRDGRVDFWDMVVLARHWHGMVDGPSTQVDLDRDGALTRMDWEVFKRIFFYSTPLDCMTR